MRIPDRLENEISSNDLNKKMIQLIEVQRNPYKSYKIHLVDCFETCLFFNYSDLFRKYFYR